MTSTLKIRFGFFVLMISVLFSGNGYADGYDPMEIELLDISTEIRLSMGNEEYYRSITEDLDPFDGELFAEEIAKAKIYGLGTTEDVVGGCQDALKFEANYSMLADTLFAECVLFHGMSPERYDEAIIRLKSAAKAGYNSAQLRLGFLYLTGTAVTRSISHGLAWIKIAADNNAEYWISIRDEKYEEYGREYVRASLEIEELIKSENGWNK